MPVMFFAGCAWASHACDAIRRLRLGFYARDAIRSLRWGFLCL